VISHHILRQDKFEDIVVNIYGNITVKNVFGVFGSLKISLYITFD